MGTKEIVISNKECYVSIGTLPAAIAIGYLIRELKGSVKTLNDLFQPAIFSRDRIVIGKPNDLNQVEIHSLQHKLLLSKFVCGIAVSDKPESMSGELLEFGKRHTHCQDTRSHITCARYLVSKDGLLNGIHDKPNIVTNTFDFCVGFVGRQVVGGLVVIMINERFNKSCSRFSVITDRDMRDFYLMYFPQSPGSNPGRKTQVDVVSETKTHDVGGKIPESQVDSTFRQ